MASQSESTTIPSSSVTTVGLPLDVERQLLREIERRGGILSGEQNFRLREITDGDVELYGEPASDRRRKVQNRFDRYKRWIEEGKAAKYINLLSERGVIGSTSNTNESDGLEEEIDSSRDSDGTETEENDTKPAAIDRQTTVPSTSRKGIPSHVEKTLLREIERRGGILSGTQNFHLRDILNSNSALFGQIGSKERRQVQNRFDNYKHWIREGKADKYITLLHNVLERPSEDKEESDSDDESHRADSEQDNDKHRKFSKSKKSKGLPTRASAIKRRKKRSSLSSNVDGSNFHEMMGRFKDFFDCLPDARKEVVKLDVSTW